MLSAQRQTCDTNLFKFLLNRMMHTMTQLQNSVSQRLQLSIPVAKVARAMNVAVCIVLFIKNSDMK